MAAVRFAMLRRAQVYLRRYLALHGGGDLTAAKVELMLSDIDATLTAADEPPAPPDKPRMLSETTIFAGVDGRSELIITPTGMYWRHYDWAKPFNVTVDGKPWAIEWSKPSDRVADTSQPLAMKWARGRVRIERLDGPNLNRGAIETRTDGQNTIVSINDHPNGAANYQLKIVIER